MPFGLLDAVAHGWALYLNDAAHDLEVAAVVASPNLAEELLDQANFMHAVARDLLMEELATVE